MQRSLLFRLALVVGLAATPLWAGDEPLPGSVVIGGKTFEIYPPDKLRARGYAVPEIPHDENAAWVYIDAINTFKNLPKDFPTDAFYEAVGGTWPEGETGERLAEWLERNKPTIDLSRRATDMTDYYMPLFRGQSDALIEALLPNLRGRRQLAKLLAVDAARQMATGDAASAIDTYLTIERMGHHVAHGHTLIEGLVGLAVSGVAERGFMRVAESGKADARTLQSATAEMDALAATFPDWETMMRGEQIFSSSIVDDAMDLPGMMSLGLGQFPTGQGRPPAPTGWTRLAARLKRLFFPDRAMKKHLRDHYDTLIAATRHDDGSVGMTISEDEVFARIPAWDVAARMFVPSLERCYELTLRGRSNFVRARTALAVAAYKKDHSDNPPALAALVPGYLPAVPIDPMTGHLLEPDKPADAPNGGLLFVNRDREKTLREKRREPAVGGSRQSRWRRYAESFAARYRLTPAQQAAAEAVVRDIETRAARFEASRAAEIERMAAAGRYRRLNDRLAPLDAMFDELKRRLDELPTADQKASARDD
ncbi:MAG: hypothetical protein ACE5F9_02045 [Phycisphaerae bacterium]